MATYHGLPALIAPHVPHHIGWVLVGLYLIYRNWAVLIGQAIPENEVDRLEAQIVEAFPEAVYISLEPDLRLVELAPPPGLNVRP
jgi:hypothetical protein